MNSKSKPSFRLPEGYFESVQDHWKIKSLSLKKQGGFGIPKHYLAKKNIDLLKTEISTGRSFNLWMYSAAASIILFLAIFLENNTTSFPEKEETIEETILLAEEAWENEILFSLEGTEFSFENELVLENSIDYFIEDERFVNLMYEDYE